MRILWSLLLLSSFLLGFKVGEKLPPSLQQKLQLQENHVTIIDFFASWCHSCKKELPLLQKLYHDNPHISLIGIDIDKDSKKGVAFQKKLKLNFPIINDTNHTIVKAFNPIAMPSLYYIKEGKILKIVTGAKADIATLIQKDLQSLH
jgi:thiol-disulfide isomerase/thioredoxin